MNAAQTVFVLSRPRAEYEAPAPPRISDPNIIWAPNAAWSDGLDKYYSSSDAARGAGEAFVPEDYGLPANQRRQEEDDDSDDDFDAGGDANDYAETACPLPCRPIIGYKLASPNPWAGGSDHVQEVAEQVREAMDKRFHDILKAALHGSTDLPEEPFDQTFLQLCRQGRFDLEPYAGFSFNVLRVLPRQMQESITSIVIPREMLYFHYDEEVFTIWLRRGSKKRSFFVAMLRKKFPNLREVALYVPVEESDFDPSMDGPGDITEEDSYVESAAIEFCEMLNEGLLDTVGFLIPPSSYYNPKVERRWRTSKIDWMLKKPRISDLGYEAVRRMPPALDTKLEYLAKEDEEDEEDEEAEEEEESELVTQPVLQPAHRWSGAQTVLALTKRVE